MTERKRKTKTEGGEDNYDDKVIRQGRDKINRRKARVHDGQDERPQDRKRKETLGDRGREEH